MSAARSDGGVAADPNVTPMIDVLLVLLVTFLIALPLSRRTIDAQLPQPATDRGGAPQIVLTVQRDGSFLLEAMDAARGSGVRVIGIAPDSADR